MRRLPSTILVIFGRYNEVYDPPREILKSIPGVTLVEMERNREKGMCCGAGGGLMWMEEETGHRINVARTEQALAVNPTVISSGCPFCLTMLSDGTKAKEVEENVKTYDVAELLEKAVIGEACNSCFLKFLESSLLHTKSIDVI